MIIFLYLRYWNSQMTVFISILLFCYFSLGSLKVYHLFGVCFYRGVGAEGHYYAETLSPTSNIWLRFNAASICRVATCGVNNDIPALIFYRLRTLPWTIQSTDTTPLLNTTSLPNTTPPPNTTPLSSNSFRYHTSSFIPIISFINTPQ